MSQFTKLMVLGSLSMLIATFVLACCCGGGGSSTDFDELFEEIAESSTSGSTEFGATCNDTKSLSQCTEYTKGAMELLGEDFYKGMCELTSGVWTSDKCPTADLIGTCDDGVGSKTSYYTVGDLAYGADTAKSACDFTSGTWTTP